MTPNHNLRVPLPGAAEHWGATARSWGHWTAAASIPPTPSTQKHLLQMPTALGGDPITSGKRVVGSIGAPRVTPTWKITGLGGVPAMRCWEMAGEAAGRCRQCLPHLYLTPSFLTLQPSITGVVLTRDPGHLHCLGGFDFHCSEISGTLQQRHNVGPLRNPLELAWAPKCSTGHWAHARWIWGSPSLRGQGAALSILGTGTSWSHCWLL